jgi:hypothetical protein
MARGPGRRQRSTAFLAAIIAGLGFGAVDQYLGSLRLLVWFGAWPSTVSQMSAPWLVLPFAVGCTQVRPRRAMLLGLVATESALVGYFLMTLSPFEGVPLGSFSSGWVRLTGSGLNPIYIVAGAATGALFGLLGQRWRVDRSWASALLVTGALCLEPTARALAGRLSPPTAVWDAEIAVGLMMAVAFVIATLAHRRTRPPEARIEI